MTPLLSLGPHVFQVTALNYQSMTRVTEAKWPAIARFGTYPGRQFTGFGEDSVTIEGLLFPHEFDDREHYEALRLTQAAKRPVTMMGWAAGGVAAQIFGRVVILKIEDTQSRIDRAGQGRRVEYTLTLAPFHGEGKPIGLFG